jgi:hypothetical protein
LKKRSKKLLSVLSRTFPESTATADAKVFWFFFAKKNILPVLQPGVAIHPTPP